MRSPLPRNALVAAALVAGALGVFGVVHLRGASPTTAPIATEPGVSAGVNQTVSKLPLSPSASPAPPGAPPRLAGAPPSPADPGSDLDSDADSDSQDSDSPVLVPPPAPPPAPITLEEYLQHGSKEPLVPPVITVSAMPMPGSVPTEAPLVPPVIAVSATAIGAPADSVAGAAPLVPPVVNVAAPATPR